MRYGPRSAGAFLRRYAWGVILLAAVAAATLIGVGAWKARNPSAMTVLEAQTLDMSEMAPPEGPVPVAAEVVHFRAFTGSATYTGTVAPLQEQVIYPRVEGVLKGLVVYNGNSVVAGQLLGVVLSPDLGTKAAEAAAGYMAATHSVETARLDVTRARSERATAQSDIEAAVGELDRAEGMVSAAQSSVAEAQKAVESAAANVDYWNAEIAREEKLLKSGAVSLQEYQSEKAQALTARAELQSRQARLAEAQANVTASKGDVVSKRATVRSSRQRAATASIAVIRAEREVKREIDLAQQARSAAETASVINDYRLVRAPFAGVVTNRLVSPGQFVTTNSAILNIAQIDRVRLQANVTDKDIPNIRIGTAVVSRSAKYPDLEIPATVTSISPAANPDSRTAIVEAIVANPGHRLVPGDSITMSITTSHSSHVITVPVNAVVQMNGRNAVWIVRRGRSAGAHGMPAMPGMPGMSGEKTSSRHPESGPGNSGKLPTAHLAMVTTGATDGRRVEVVSGLSDGDEVIYQGNMYLREGDEVFLTGWGASGPLEMPPPREMSPMPGMSR